MRRTFIALSALLVATMMVLAAMPISTAASHYPVPYNFLSSAVLAGSADGRRSTRCEQLEVPSDGAAPAPGRTRARHRRQQEHQLADLRPAAGQQRLLRVRADLRRHGGHAEGPRPVRWPGPDRDQRPGAEGVRGPGARGDRCPPGRHPRPLAGHADARLLREVPRRGAATSAATSRWRRCGTAPACRAPEQLTQVDGGLRSASTRRCPVRRVPRDGDRVGVHAQDAARGSRGRRRSATPTSSRSTTSWWSPYTSGIETGMRNIVVQSHCSTDYTEHFEIAADPVAAATSSTRWTPPTRAASRAPSCCPSRGRRPPPADTGGDLPDRLARRGAVAQSVRAEDS